MTEKTLPIDVHGNWYEVPVQVQLHIIAMRDRLAGFRAEGESAMSTNDGGPFHPTTQQIDGNGEVIMYAYCGASLRDHFAGLAMAAIIPDTQLGFDAICTEAYQYADAMLAAREQRT